MDTGKNSLSANPPWKIQKRPHFHLVACPDTVCRLPAYLVACALADNFPLKRSSSENSARQQKGMLQINNTTDRRWHPACFITL